MLNSENSMLGGLDSLPLLLSWTESTISILNLLYYLRNTSVIFQLRAIYYEKGDSNVCTEEGRP